MKPNWLTVKNAGSEPAEIIISGQIGQSWWDESGMSSKEFNDAIKDIPKGKKINLRINSQGGSVKDGLEIYNAIKARASDVTSYITGYAVSIASVIPLAAGRVISPKSSIWMIHEPSMFTEGNADDHLKSAEMLDKHGDMLASIYSAELGKSKSAMRDAMRTETWFTGEEALDFGLSDECGDEDVDPKNFSRFDMKDFRNVPANILNILGAPKGANNIERDRPITGTPNPSTSETAGEQTNTAAGQSGAPNTQKTMTTTVAPAAATPTAEEVNALNAKIEALNRKTIENLVRDYVAQNKITKEEMPIFVEAALKDEKGTLAILDAKKAPQTETVQNNEGFEFNRLDSVVDGVDFGDITGKKLDALVNIRKAHKTPKARYDAMKADWSNLLKMAESKDGGRSVVLNTNTYSSTLITSFLVDGSVTDLQNRWAMLKAFSLDLSVDPYKPKATAVIKHVTVGGTTQTDATNFESGDSTVAPVSVVMHQYSQSFAVSNSDLQSGLRMDNLVTINTANFANKVIEVATVPITTTLFTATPVVSSAAAFGFSDLATLQAALKKSPIKNLILDGAYIARIANTPAFFQTAGVVGGDTGAWKAFGWDMIAQNTDWTGAGANVVGFACNPQAIAGVTGLPVTPNNIPGGIYSTNTAVVPGLEASILLSSWFNPSTRTMWSGIDIMAGFKELDTTAGVLVTSA